MPGIPLSDGKYWGVDVDVRDSEILVSGYHRDVFSGGSLEEVTDIFLLYGDSPLSSSDWTLNPRIIHDIEADPSQSDPLSVEFGHEQAHILYQTVRNDTTGKDRLGVWYSHGEIDQETWSYRKAVGDEAALPMLKVIVEDKEDRLVSLWREGEAQDSEIVVYVTDSSFRSEEGMESRLSARGLANIDVVESERGIQVFFDRVGPNGPQVEYGLIDLDQGWVGLSNSIVQGQFNSLDRSEEIHETMIVISFSGGWQIRALIDDGGGKRSGDLADQIRSSLGLDQESFEILVIGVAFAVLILGMVTLVALSAQGIRWAGKRRSLDDDSSVIMEDDVVDIVRDSDLAVGVDEVEIVDGPPSPDEGDGSGIQSRRDRRARRSSEPEIASETDESPIEEPLLGLPEISPSPPSSIGGQVSCFGCGSKFVADAGVSSAKCPVCGSRVDL